MVVSVVTENLAPPVHVGIGVDIGSGCAVDGVVVAVQRRVAVRSSQSVKPGSLVYIVGVGVGVGKLWSAGCKRKAVLVLGGHFQGAVLAALCSNHYYAIGALDPVQGHGGGILEHGNGFYLQSVEVSDLTHETVHHNERTVAVEAELGLVFIGAARTLLHKKAGELAVESLCNVKFGALFKKLLSRCLAGPGHELEEVPKRDGIYL